MNWRKATTWIPGAVMLVLVGSGGLWLLRKTETSVLCPICQREIHRKAQAIAEIEGERSRVCCITCALTAGRQSREPVRLIEVIDYTTDRPLQPEDAYFVQGSQIILCERHEPLIAQDKQPFHRMFDRCEPSIFAFSRREKAEAFARANAGAVLRREDLLKGTETQP